MFASSICVLPSVYKSASGAGISDCQHIASAGLCAGDCVCDTCATGFYVNATGGCSSCLMANWPVLVVHMFCPGELQFCSAPTSNGKSSTTCSCSTCTSGFVQVGSGTFTCSSCLKVQLLCGFGSTVVHRRAFQLHHRGLEWQQHQ